MITGYVCLIFTAILEALGIALLNKADGLNKLWHIIAGIAILDAGMLIFSIALKYIDMTIANTIWGGLNILIVAIIGFFVFDEKYSATQYSFIAMVVVGMIGLNMTGLTNPD